MVFNLVTLPVEFDASRAPRRSCPSWASSAARRRSQAVNKVLNAAALTYVAAFLISLAILPVLPAMLLGGGRRR